MKGLTASFLVTNSRQGDIYTRYLKILIQSTGGKWTPKIIMADMEGGIHVGIRQAFAGRTKSRKCWFHINHAVYRHTHKKGRFL